MQLCPGVTEGNPLYKGLGTMLHHPGANSALTAHSLHCSHMVCPMCCARYEQCWPQYPWREPLGVSSVGWGVGGDGALPAWGCLPARSSQHSTELGCARAACRHGYRWEWQDSSDLNHPGRLLVRSIA